MSAKLAQSTSWPSAGAEWPSTTRCQKAGGSPLEWLTLQSFYSGEDSAPPYRLIQLPIGILKAPLLPGSSA